ncbi:MAG TPA: formylglycine-generating enzyme family protein [Pyrinomonadaceae bacterium]|nr:formylglycine-generating enzyme family protein [Pyrinomonadaceae bacterium]
MKKLYAVGGAVFVVIIATVSLLYFRSDERRVRLHYEREETEVIISNIPGAQLTLFKAGNNLQDSVAMLPTGGEQIWLPRGNYFLEADQSGRKLFYPLPLVGYRAGPDKEGTFTVTIRSLLTNSPHGLLPDLPDFVFIPSGHFLFGDHMRVQEPHYVWLGGFFINPFEVTNAEFREFLIDPRGYTNDANWTEAGRKWKAANTSHSTALLKPADADFKRFGQPDQPVVQVNWFEANAYCHWLNGRVWGGKWIFALPTEAEWEKAARGPDNFDYGLGMTVSDNEVGLYNWKKNPGAEVTVVGLQETKSKYQANRYGIYHMTGNVAEWTQSIYRTYSRQHPYVDDDDRNHDEVAGERVLRGGSWYTASIAVLYIPYRENFQPEVQTPYLGFRVVARPVP